MKEKSTAKIDCDVNRKYNLFSSEPVNGLCTSNSHFWSIHRIYFNFQQQIVSVSREENVTMPSAVKTYRIDDESVSEMGIQLYLMPPTIPI